MPGGAKAPVLEGGVGMMGAFSRQLYQTGGGEGDRCQSSEEAEEVALSWSKAAWEDGGARVRCRTMGAEVQDGGRRASAGYGACVCLVELLVGHGPQQLVSNNLERNKGQKSPEPRLLGQRAGKLRLP